MFYLRTHVWRNEGAWCGKGGRKREDESEEKRRL